MKTWTHLAQLLVAVAAQTLGAGAIAGESAPTGTPCYRAYCGNLLELAEPPSQERKADKQSPRPAQKEEYNCLLTFAIGGELAAKGSRSVKLLGQTRVLGTK